MNVLGIAGRRRHAAVALAVDGSIVAAAEEACLRVAESGYAQSGGFPAGAVEACLRRAGMDVRDVNQLAVVDETSAGALGDTMLPAIDSDPSGTALAQLPRQRVNPLEADARLCVVANDATDMLVFSVDPPALAVYGRAVGGLRLRVLAGGADRLVEAARLLARALGVPASNPFAALDGLSVAGDPEFAQELGEILSWQSHAGMVIDPDALLALVRRTLDGLAVDDFSSINIKGQQRRAALAASFIERLAAVVHDAARSTCRGSQISFGGALFTGSRLNTRLKQLMGDSVSIAPVPESIGRAIGAAADGRVSSGVAGLALGPSFTEAEIKATLDNCRLDYVYEPDWNRLLTRASRMLSRGMVIGWFQGPMVFGPRSLGTRSVLCDPSTRYARENVNEYLKRRPLDEPLPVSFVPQCADECLSTPIRSPFMLLDAAVKSPWRDRVRAALDHRYEARIHTISTEQAPELMDLLKVHFERSGVPGLINTTMSGPGEPIACSPRDAVRTVYSSAIDALIIGRFLLMKDYWLLRSDAN